MNTFGKEKLRPEFERQLCYSYNCCRYDRLLAEQKAEDVRLEAHSQMDAVMAKVADQALTRDVAEAVRKNGGVPEKPKRVRLPVVADEPDGYDRMYEASNIVIRGNTFTNETRDAVKLEPMKFTSFPPMDERTKERFKKLLESFSTLPGGKL